VCVLTNVADRDGQNQSFDGSSSAMSCKQMVGTCRLAITMQPLVHKQPVIEQLVLLRGEAGNQAGLVERLTRRAIDLHACVATQRLLPQCSTCEISRTSAFVIIPNHAIYSS
jgi:hypothetical protein